MYIMCVLYMILYCSIYCQVRSGVEPVTLQAEYCNSGHVGLHIHMHVYTVAEDVYNYTCIFISRFEDIVLTESDGIPTLEFLDSCRAVVPFFGKLHTPLSL